MLRLRRCCRGVPVATGVHAVSTSSPTTTAPTTPGRLTRRHSLAFGGRIVLHFLPPQLPAASCIEHIWQDLRTNVIGYDSLDPAALRAAA